MFHASVCDTVGSNAIFEDTFLILYKFFDVTEIISECPEVTLITG